MMRLMILATITALLLLPLAVFAQQPCPGGVCPVRPTTVINPVVAQEMPGPGPVAFAQYRPRLYERLIDRAKEFNANRPRLFDKRCR